MRTRGMRPVTILSAVRANARDDAGVALVTVVAMSAILFLLTTTILGVVAFQASQVSREIRRNEAMHVADAGINAYLYELRKNPKFWETTDTLAGTLDSGDTWEITATPTTTEQGEDMPLTLYATGRLASTGTTRTVVAVVDYPSLAQPKYTIMAQGTLAVYPGTHIYGDVIVQKQSAATAAILNLGGHIVGVPELGIAGFARCYGTAPGPSGVINVYGTGEADGGLQPFYAPSTEPQFDIDSQFTVTNATLITQAQAANTYFPRPGDPTPGKGYWIELNHDTATVWAIGGSIVTGVVGGAPGSNFPNKWVIATYDLASHPVFYFFNGCYVSGTYSSSLTIGGAGERIWLYHNILPDPIDGPATLGIVSDRDVGVPWMRSTPDNLTVYAAIFAKARAIFKGDSMIPNGEDQTRGTFTLYGSLTAGGAMVGSNALQQYDPGMNNFLAGYESMEIHFDERLLQNAPPEFPLLTTGSTSRDILTLDSWVEQ